MIELYDISLTNRANSPSSSSTSLNAIETFVVTCILSIFAAIIEYAVILAILCLR